MTGHLSDLRDGSGPEQRLLAANLPKRLSDHN